MFVITKFVITVIKFLIYDPRGRIFNQSENKLVSENNLNVFLSCDIIITLLIEKESDTPKMSGINWKVPYLLCIDTFSLGQSLFEFLFLVHSKLNKLWLCSLDLSKIRWWMNQRLSSKSSSDMLWKLKPIQ